MNPNHFARTARVARFAGFLVAAALVACSSTEQEPPSVAEPPEITALIAGLRSNDPALRAATAAGAPKLGPSAITVIRQRALDPALPDQVRSVADAYAAFATAALAKGNDAMRAPVATAFLGVLETDLPILLREELLRQVAVVANDSASIARLGALMVREDSRDGARRALEAIVAPEADRALIAALDAAPLGRKADFARSLGRKRVLSAVKPLTTLASASDPNAAAAGRFALARIGDAQSKGLLLAALDPAKPATADDILVFAERRTAQDDFESAEMLYATLLSQAAPHHRSAAAIGLAKVEQRVVVPVKENVDALVHALADDDAEVRVAAEDALLTLQSTATLALLRQSFWQGEASLRPALLRILAANDPQRTELLSAGLHDPVAEVRAEAIRISARDAGVAEAREYLKIAADETGVERDAAIDSALAVSENLLDQQRPKESLQLAREVAAVKPSTAQARDLTRLLMRLADPSCLEWIDPLAEDPNVADDVARAKLVVATAFAKRDKALAIHAIESVYLTARSGSLRRAALDRIGMLGGDTASAVRKSGFLAEWQIIGPFAKATAEDFETQPFGESIDLGSAREGLKGPASWRRLDLAGFDGVVDLEKLLDPHDDCTAFGYCEFDSEGGDHRLMVGSDDGCAVWLNGALILSKNIDRGVVIDDDKIDVTLLPGKNSVLIKIAQGNGGFGFCARIVKGHAEKVDTGTQ